MFENEYRRDFLKCMAWAGTRALFAFEDQSFVKDGLTLTEWSRGGLRFAAVIDLPPAELQQFETLFARCSSWSFSRAYGWYRRLELR